MFKFLEKNYELDLDQVPMPSWATDLDLAVLDTENQDNAGGLENFDEAEDIVLIDDEENG